MAADNLPCWVYRSPRKQEMYLYLAREDDFDSLPEALLQQFGDPVLVIELELNPERRLARGLVGQQLDVLPAESGLGVANE